MNKMDDMSVIMNYMNGKMGRLERMIVELKDTAKDIAGSMRYVGGSKRVKKDIENMPMETYEAVMAAALPYLSRAFDILVIEVVRASFVVVEILKHPVGFVRGVNVMRNVLGSLSFLVKYCETRDLFTKGHGSLFSQLRRSVLDMIVKRACEDR